MGIDIFHGAVFPSLFFTFHGGKWTREWKKNLNIQHCMCLWWAIGNIGNMICVTQNSKSLFMKMWMSTATAQKFNAFGLFTFEFNWKCHHCGLSWMNYVSNFVYKRLFSVRGPSNHSFGVSNESFRFRFRITSRMVKQWCMRESSSWTWSHNGQDIFSQSYTVLGLCPLNSFCLSHPICIISSMTMRKVYFPRIWCQVRKINKSSHTWSVGRSRRPESEWSKSVFLCVIETVFLHSITFLRNGMSCPIYFRT